MTNEELFFVKHLAKTLGTENVDVIPRTGGADNYLRADDLNPNSNGARQILGSEPGSKLAGITMRDLTKRLSASNLGESMDSLVFSRPGTAIGNYSLP